MSLRNRLQVMMPGLSADPARYNAEATILAARSATQYLYGSVFGTNTVVQSLDQPNVSGLMPTEVASTNPLAFGPIWMSAIRIGALGIKTYRFTEETAAGRRQREEANDHPAYQLLRRPNPDITRSELIAGTVGGIWTFGSVCWLKERKYALGPNDPSNPVVALWPIPGNAIYVKRDPQRIIGGYVLRVAGQEDIPLPTANICHFRLMPGMTDWAQSTSPFQTLGNVTDAGGAAISALTKLFRTSFLQRLWINLHGAELDDDARNRLRAEMELARARPGGVPIMESGATIEDMSRGPDHTLLANTLKEMQDLVGKTMGFPDDVSDDKKFYAMVVQPICDAMEQELERTLMTEWPRDVAFPEFGYRTMLNGTPEERAKLHQIRILSGQETPNEGRSDEDKGPLPGGDVLLVPLNVVVLQQAVEQGNSVPPAAASKDGFGGGEGRQSGGGAITAPVPQLKAAASGDVAPKLREQGRENWATARQRLVDTQGRALDRRMRGAVKGEFAQLRDLFSRTGEEPPHAPVPDVLNEALSIMEGTSSQMRTVLTTQMRQTSDEAFDLADMFLSDPIIDRTGVKTIAPDAIGQLMQGRATQMSDAFAQRRADAFEELLQAEGADARTFVSKMRALWTGFESHANVIGMTETSWAFERAAAAAWHGKGSPEVVIVRGSSLECTSGACPRVEGQKYSTSDVPTPLHPGCDCHSIPAGLAG